MKNVVRVSLAVVGLVVGGCYAKLDDPSVAVTNPLNNVPGLPQVTVPPVTISNVRFEIGNITVDESMKDSSLTVNKVTLESTTAGVTFAGITEAAVAVVPPPGRPDLTTQTVASYRKDPAAPVSGTLVLEGVASVNLIPYLTATTLTLSVSAGGVPPGPSSWNGTLTVDFHVVAQKNLP